jgi:PTH1 family peptidyl-tRNA hydrolase
MKLIVGLGNPGSEYERTRHNAGFMALDRASARLANGAPVRSKWNSTIVEADVKGEKTLFMKPLTFMNRSGTPVAEALNFYKMNPAADLLVLVDDYALPMGTIRLREGGGDGGHNGLTDVERALGTQTYPRLRIGIDRPPVTYSDPADWVLGRFDDAQLASLRPTLDRTADAVECFISRGLSAAMNRFNASPSVPPPPATPSPPPPLPPGRQSAA